MTLIIKKYHQVFDTACKTKERAEEILEGWEHKERIKPVYMIFNSTDIQEEEIHLLDLDYPHYHTVEEANDFLLEEDI